MKGVAYGKGSMAGPNYFAIFASTLSEIFAMDARDQQELRTSSTGAKIRHREQASDTFFAVFRAAGPGHGISSCTHRERVCISPRACCFAFS